MTTGKSNHIKFQVIITILLLIFCSCARQTPNQSENSISEFGKVRLDEFSGNNSVQNYSEGLSKDNLETIGSDQVYVAPQRLPLISLHLDSGLMRSISHIVVLKSLLANNINVRLISGEGVGAVIAAMFAFGETPESIEWSFHRFSQDVTNVAPFGKEWRDSFEKNILSFFNNKKIEQANIPLLVYVYDKSQNKIIALNRGDLRDVINNSLEWGRVNAKYATSVGRAGNRVDDLSRFGADIMILSQTVGQEIKLSRPNDYLTGIYARAVSVSNQTTGEWSSIIRFDFNKMNIDTLESYPHFLKSASSSLNSWSQELIKIRNDWKPIKNVKDKNLSSPLLLEYTDSDLE